MPLNHFRRLCALWLGAALLGGCAARKEIPIYREFAGLPAAQEFRDEAPRQPLLAALQAQIAALEKNGDLARLENFGDRRIPRQALLDTLRQVKKLFEADLAPEKLAEEMNRRFVFLKVGRTPQEERAFFTGYYTPLFPAWPTEAAASPPYYPIYAPPAGLHHYPLQQLDPLFKDWRLAYTVAGNELTVLPERQVLYAKPWEKGRPLAFLLDPLDRHILEVQGSGILLFPDGTRLPLNYAGDNGFPFITVGQLLAADGKLARREVSLPAIRRYFKDHPQERDVYLARIRRAIFFRPVQPREPFPQGAPGIAVTPGRSIASDKSLFPVGALAYLCLPWPTLPGDAAEPRLWQKHCRLALDQDSGGGINGPGRIDLYLGEGVEAEEIAGRLAHRGELYYLLSRPAPLN